MIGLHELFTSERSRKKLELFFRFATELGELSCCKRMAVGCIVVPRDFSRVMSVGYNGPAAGRNNDSCTEQAGDCTCAHAEANAVGQLTEGTRLLMLCTHGPCVACANAIINSRRIDCYFFRHDYRDPRGLAMLEACMVVGRIK